MNKEALQRPFFSLCFENRGHRMVEKRWMRVYYDFGGVERLGGQDKTGEKVGGIFFLSTQDAYTLHKPTRMHFTTDLWTNFKPTFTTRRP